MKHLFVITSYPKQGATHGDSTVGVASYTKNTLLTLKKQMPDTHITVWAEIHDQDIERVYEEDGMTIKRVWRRGDMYSLWYLYKQIRERNVDDILIPIEAFMFGSYAHLALFVGLMTMLHASGKRITTVLHQVVVNTQALEPDPTRRRLMNLAMSLFYSGVLATSTQTIVFERAFKVHLEQTCLQKRLVDLGSKLRLLRKQAPKGFTLWQMPAIHVIPHAVEELKKLPDPLRAKKRLRWNPKHKYVLCFGFLAPHKGLDKLVELWPSDKRIHLILAGGENPNHIKNKDYRKYVKRLRDTAAKKGIAVTGFVPERQIATYFSAADLVILPYTTFISSSGPLSLAFAAEKPVLFSEAISDYFDTADFRRALTQNALTRREFTFRFSEEDLKKGLDTLFSNLQAATKFSQAVKQLRDWDHIGTLYQRVLTP